MGVKVGMGVMEEDRVTVGEIVREAVGVSVMDNV